VLAGGPGTGKTTTVAKLIAVLQDQAAGRLRVALAAPTAVAAARLTFAAAAAVGRFPEPDQQRVGPLEATTLHRLLGRRPGSRTRFRHDRDNRLPFDVVVVDEASMVSLTLMSRLVDALRSDSRLLLVGDPDQLASVEAGAVLGDLVQREAPAAVTGPTGSGLARHDLDSLAEPERDAVVRRGVVRLAEVHRFSGAIQALAEAVRLGRPAEVLAVLDGSEEGVEFVELDPAAPGREVPDSVRADVVAAGASLHEAARAGDGETALRRLAAHQLLCGHREGPYGVAHWNRRAEEWLRGSVEGYAADGPWYVGRPLLVTANDYQLRLFNGDTGVVVEVGGHPRAAFHRGGTLHLLAPSRLPDVTTVHAMSVHRSQGSQYDAVTVVLPPVDSPLLTRELLYTALTRAKRRVRILGSRAAVEGAVQRPIVRASGLRARA
jgi:exodeoxyribonuclease V alpha subunit